MQFVHHLIIINHFQLLLTLNRRFSAGRPENSRRGNGSGSYPVLVFNTRLILGPSALPAGDVPADGGYNLCHIPDHTAGRLVFASFEQIRDDPVQRCKLDIFDCRTWPLEALILSFGGQSL